MKKFLILLTCMVMICGIAAAEQTVELPSSRYVLEIPDDMVYSAPEAAEHGMEAYYSDKLEMDFVAYPKTEAANIGMAETLKGTAKSLREAGMEAELRKVNGVEMVCFRVTDPSDGAPCIGYVFEDGEWLVEVDFWYASEDAAEETRKIMETIRKGE